MGTFLRSFRFGHVRQLDAVAFRLLTGLTGHAPLLPVSTEVTFVDNDDTIRSTFGYAKQSAGYSYSGVKGLNAFLATASTAISAPVIVRPGSGKARRTRRGRRPVGRRRPGHDRVMRGHRPGGAPRGQRVLRAGRHRGRPKGRIRPGK